MPDSFASTVVPAVPAMILPRSARAAMAEGDRRVGGVLGGEYGPFPCRRREGDEADQAAPARKTEGVEKLLMGRQPPGWPPEDFGLNCLDSRTAQRLGVSGDGPDLTPKVHH